MATTVSQANLTNPYEREHQHRRPLIRAKTASDFRALSSSTSLQGIATTEVQGSPDTFSRPRGFIAQLHPSASHSMTSLRPVSRDARPGSEPIQCPPERTESFARSLFSKSSLLLRRKNSKAPLTSLQTVEWDNDQGERANSKEVQGLTTRTRSKQGEFSSISYGTERMPSRLQ